MHTCSSHHWVEGGLLRDTAVGSSSELVSKPWLGLLMVHKTHWVGVKTGLTGHRDEAFVWLSEATHVSLLMTALLVSALSRAPQRVQVFAIRK